MADTELKERIFDVARNIAQKGPGYAQESVVLRDAVEQLRLQDDLAEQQRLLTCWHDLFREGRLSWGYDVDNPSAALFFTSPIARVGRRPLHMDSIRLDLGQSLQSNSGYWYKNRQVLGTGGNAATYLVVATSGPNKGVPFAAKVFRRLSKPERRESFLKEFRFLRSCDHPSIMRVFDEGVFYEDHPFLVAEYLPNTLSRVLRAGSAPLTLKISFTLQLLSALSYLSTLDPPVIHRDIKPENIFVKGHSCVLGDFGLMKHAAAPLDDDQAALKESLGVGMPLRYRTPDLVAYLTSGATLTVKSDVFQLGLVIAEMFTGRNPLRHSNQADPFTSPVEVEPLKPIPGRCPLELPI